MKGKIFGNTTLREAYTRSQRNVKRLIRQAKPAFEKGLAERSKKNPKEIWMYIRSKLRTKTGVSPLRKNIEDPSSLKFNDKDKAERPVLQRAHTKENGGDIPTLHKKTDKYGTSISLHRRPTGKTKNSIFECQYVMRFRRNKPTSIDPTCRLRH